MSESQTQKTFTSKENILIVIILFLPMLFLHLISIVLVYILVALLCSLLIVAFVGILELIAGLVMVGIGIEKLFSMPMGAFAVMGFGLVNIGVALLLECVVFWLYGVAIPSFFKKISGKEEKNEKVS